MAAKKTVNLDSIFAKTEPQPKPQQESPNADLDSGNGKTYQRLISHDNRIVICKAEKRICQ